MARLVRMYTERTRGGAAPVDRRSALTILGAAPVALMGQKSQMEILHKNNSGPYALAQDSEHVYWMDGFELLAASKTSKEAKVIGNSRSSTDWSLLERGGYVYKIDRGGITRLPVQGGQEDVVYD